jgi:hypothetical protein
VAALGDSCFRKSHVGSVYIPRHIEGLGSECFSFCRLFSSIPFEIDSQSKTIERKTFAFSWLTSVIVPRTATSIDISAFLDVNLFSISLEGGNDAFAVEGSICLVLTLGC